MQLIVTNVSNLVQTFRKWRYSDIVQRVSFFFISECSWEKYMLTIMIQSKFTSFFLMFDYNFVTSYSRWLVSNPIKRVIIGYLEHINRCLSLYSFLCVSSSLIITSSTLYLYLKICLFLPYWKSTCWYLRCFSYLLPFELSLLAFCTTAKFWNTKSSFHYTNSYLLLKHFLGINSWHLYLKWGM